MFDPSTFKAEYEEKAFDDVLDSSLVQQLLYSIVYKITVPSFWKDDVSRICANAVKDYYGIERDDFEIVSHNEDVFISINPGLSLPAIDAYGVLRDDDDELCEFADVDTFANWFKGALPDDWIIDIFDYNIMTKEDYLANED